MTTQKIIRVPEVLSKSGISRSTLARFVKYDKNFPRPFKIGERSTGFLESEVDQWILGRRAEASRTDATLKEV